MSAADRRAAAMADAGRVIAGQRAGHPARGARDGDAAPHRPRQADAVRDARAGPRGRRRPRPVRGQRRGRHRGAVARRGARAPRGEGRGRLPDHRGEPAPHPARGRRRGSSGATSSPGSRTARARPPTAPFDLVLVDPPYADTAGLVRAPRARRPAVRDGRRRSSRSTSGGTRRPRGSVCWRPSASAGSARRR